MSEAKPILNLDDRDLSIKPGDDFFEYAVGTWVKNTPIPDEYSRWGSFDILHHENYDKIKILLEDDAYFLNKENYSLAARLKKLFLNGLDEELVETARLSPLRTDLGLIDAWDNLSGLARLVANQHIFSSNPLFFLFPEPDYKNSQFVLAFLMQGGLGLPDRDYYLKTDDRFVATKEKYLAHINKMFTLAGLYIGQEQSAAATVLEIETNLAEISIPREELRDSEKNYHKMGVEELNSLSPAFNWKEYFSAIGLSESVELNVGQPVFFSKLSEALEKFSLDKWKIYLKWQLLLNNAKYLSREFAEENFAFYGIHLNGQKILKPRFKRIIDQMNNLVGEAIGELYVARYFPSEHKKQMDELVKNIRLAMEKRLRSLTWMAEETKTSALKKLQALKVKTAYPDVFPDFSSWKVESEIFYDNIRSARQFEWKRQMKKINQPVDPNEWLMHAHEINAYFSRERNEIVFPAGILQPPFFHPQADRAVNYGGIGSVIGHEIIHAFDDQGRKFDERGQLRDWWSKEDEEKFKLLAAELTNQYNNYFPFPDAHINGEFTLGENIADLGGVKVGYEALKISLQNHPEDLLDNLTPEQRFFLAYAATEKGKVREEKARLALVIDPHSPSKYRVNGVVTNLTEFYEAFNVQKGDKLYRPEAERTQIW
ncbi:MAG TPA: M13 family metallopeptidase [Patescibacteria group bacterium]|nr:M13 family metallopeptidase [Patescibacteria group bacterium]